MNDTTVTGGQPVIDEPAHVRRPSFQFAKRHGVLVSGFEDGKAVIVHTDRVQPSALVELRRMLRILLEQ